MGNKVVLYEEDGLKKASVLPQSVDAELVHLGIPLSVPDVVGGIDWEAVAVDLHNLLVERGLFTVADLQAGGINRLDNAISVILRKRVLALYTQADQEAKEI